MSSDGGSTWITVDTFTLVPPAANKNTTGAWPTHATTDSAGNVIVVGKASDATTTHWIVRKRDASTGLWSMLDDFLPANGSATALSATTDAAGHLLEADAT